MGFTGIVLIVAVGVVAGFLNVTAGGGTLLVLPVLVFMGLDISIANGTNRIAILFQNIVATTRFRCSKKLDFKEAAFFALPAAAGSIMGTFFAVTLDEKVLKAVIALIILVMAFLLVFKPKMWEEQGSTRLPKGALLVAFFLIGVYGGFVQAGVGFFLLWGLAGLAGKDLVNSNALKVAIVALYTSISLAIFLINGMVNIKIGLALAAGNMIGGYAGAKFSISKGNRWLRFILIAVVTVSALKMMADVFGYTLPF